MNFGLCSTFALVLASTPARAEPPVRYTAPPSGTIHVQIGKEDRARLGGVVGQVLRSHPQVVQDVIDTVQDRLPEITFPLWTQPGEVQPDFGPINSAIESMQIDGKPVKLGIRIPKGSLKLGSSLGGDPSFVQTDGGETLRASIPLGATTLSSSTLELVLLTEAPAGSPQRWVPHSLPIAKTESGALEPISRIQADVKIEKLRLDLAMHLPEKGIQEVSAKDFTIKVNTSDVGISVELPKQTIAVPVLSKNRRTGETRKGSIEFTMSETLRQTVRESANQAAVDGGVKTLETPEVTELIRSEAVEAIDRFIDTKKELTAFDVETPGLQLTDEVVTVLENVREEVSRREAVPHIDIPRSPERLQDTKLQARLLFDKFRGAGAARDLKSPLNLARLRMAVGYMDVLFGGASPLFERHPRTQWLRDRVDELVRKKKATPQEARQMIAKIEDWDERYRRLKSLIPLSNTEGPSQYSAFEIASETESLFADLDSVARSSSPFSETLFGHPIVEAATGGFGMMELSLQDPKRVRFLLNENETSLRDWVASFQVMTNNVTNGKLFTSSTPGCVRPANLPADGTLMLISVDEINAKLKRLYQDGSFARILGEQKLTMTEPPQFQRISDKDALKLRQKFALPDQAMLLKLTATVEGGVWSTFDPELTAAIYPSDDGKEVIVDFASLDGFDERVTIGTILNPIKWVTQLVFNPFNLTSNGIAKGKFEEIDRNKRRLHIPLEPLTDYGLRFKGAEWTGDGLMKFSAGLSGGTP